MVFVFPEKPVLKPFLRFSGAASFILRWVILAMIRHYPCGESTMFVLTGVIPKSWTGYFVRQLVGFESDIVSDGDLALLGILS
jgi:hypothetical protein